MIELVAACVFAVAAPQESAADRAYVDGLDAIDLARAADAAGDADQARRLLAEARTKLDLAEGGYRAALAVDPKRDELVTRLARIAVAGRDCCGKPAIWRRYGFEGADGRRAPAAVTP